VGARVRKAVVVSRDLRSLLMAPPCECGPLGHVDVL
jgi:hypothetical protein